MTILLTGASGFMGGWIARRLEPARGELRVLARPESNLSALPRGRFERVSGDLLDRTSLDRALRSVERVIHAAGTISFRRRDAARVWESNVTGTANLFDAALAAGVERVVMTASIFALGHAENVQAVDEGGTFNAPELLDIPYIRAKVEVERLAQDAIARGLPLIRLYPGLALGPGDIHRSSSGAINAWLHGRLPAIVVGGGICLMDVRDAAAAHIAALRLGEPGRRYLATGHNIALPELFDRLASLTGLAPPVFRLPASWAAPLARVAKLAGMFPRLGPDQARLMAYRWWYDSTRGRRELALGYRPLDRTLADTLNWLLTNPAD